MLACIRHHRHGGTTYSQAHHLYALSHQCIKMPGPMFASPMAHRGSQASCAVHRCDVLTKLLLRSPSAVSWTGTAASAMSPASAYSSYSVAQPAGGSIGAGAAQQTVTGTATQGASIQAQQLQMPQPAAGTITVPRMDTQASANSLPPIQANRSELVPGMAR